MRTLLRAVLLGSVISLASGGVARAGEECPRHEKAAAKAAAAHTVGDKVYVCTCGEGCCKTVEAKPGKCGCGKDLTEGTVTKVAEGSVTVKTAKGEQVIEVK